ncbi:D-glycero-beta-D-manno-heptose 1-phosphate adenylyltransferase [Candidatus Babeliales bacterium]|nr:D-glycero-beta-D-manno-heptose 1-phosphate adenylyltransferase [Candidatus Babeliales bacterium]MCF7899238.1 D-glycero-beta-D-manno-heptose 1-phosphate adenylyltransferase [Candidatus Babeliales bacterium]
MKNIINKIKLSDKKKILIIGDVMLDEYVFGDVLRISPEAPVPILKEKKREWSLGGAANVALNCKQIGCSVDLIGVVNNLDKAAEKLISILKKNRISCNGLLRSENRVTTCKKRLMSGDQQLLRIDTEDSNELSLAEFEQILAKIDNFVSENTIILLSDYAKGIFTEKVLHEIIFKARERKCLVLLDPKGPNFDKYKGVNYLKPNYKEFEQILDFYGINKRGSVIENGKKVCEILSLDGLILTMGEKGIQFISLKEDFFVPACKREVFDLTGAGDTVLAFLALGLSVSLPVKQCLKLANHAAAVAVSHLKTYAVSLDELIDKNVEFTEKIFTEWALLKIELDWLRLENKKIVFTNGCFDLLHSGHVYLLNKAKKMGDILVVAINTDESVKRFKGESRPIKNIEERAKIIAAINGVDFVVIFDQDTPKELVEYLKPDILVKGGDYKKEQVAGYDFMIKNGGKVEIINFQKGYSTSNLIEKIQSTN